MRPARVQEVSNHEKEDDDDQREEHFLLLLGILCEHLMLKPRGGFKPPQAA